MAIPSVSTDGDGQLYTVTNIVSGASPTDSASDSATTGTSTGFFSNKGAVAAVFIIAGLAGTALVLFCCMNVMKKRRQARYEREALAHRNARNAAKSTPSAPAVVDEEPLYDAHGRPFSTSTAQMAQHSYPFAGGAFANRGSTSTVPGIAGVGARNVHDPTPETTDYYSTDAGAVNYANGPQPQPAYESSHGHDGMYDTTATDYYGQQYGQAYGDPAAYGAYGQQTTYGQQESYNQQQHQQTTAKAWATNTNASVQRDLTVPGPSRKSLRKSSGGESAKSYYSDDDPVVEGNQRQNLRVCPFLSTHPSTTDPDHRWRTNERSNRVNYEVHRSCVPFYSPNCNRGF